MSRTFLGYGYTNESGVATLDYDANDNPLPKKSYACHSRNTSVVAEVSVDNVVTSSNTIRFCENYVPPTDTLTLTGDKTILSYADGDSAILTATFDSAGAISGKSVVFKIGDTVLDTVTTDSNGQAQYEYESQGIGDVTITAECMNLQETYEICDANAYSKLTSAVSYMSGNTNQISYSSNGMYLKSSIWSDWYVNIPFELGTVVEFTAKDINSSGHSNYFNLKEENASTNIYGASFTNGMISIVKPTPAVDKSVSGNKLIKLEIDTNGEVRLYCNDTLVGTKTINTSSDLIFYWGTGTSNYCTITDFMIKPL